MGARLVAASLPIYALAVAIVVSEKWQTRTTGTQQYYWWGLAVDVAIVTLIVGGHSTGVFSRRLAVAALVYLFLLLVPFVAVIAPAVLPFVILLYYVFAWFSLFVDGAFLALYLERYRALWRRSSAVASESLSTATPLIARYCSRRSSSVRTTGRSGGHTRPGRRSCLPRRRSLGRPPSLCSRGSAGRECRCA